MPNVVNKEKQHYENHEKLAQQDEQLDDERANVVHEIQRAQLVVVDNPNDPREEENSVHQPRHQEIHSSYNVQRRAALLPFRFLGVVNKVFVVPENLNKPNDE
jgi:hypothetical protein